MTQSNTKLDRAQKEDRKQLMEMLPEGARFEYSPDNRFVFLVVPAGRVDHWHAAIASPNEKKYRRKVGEYLALCRWSDDIYMVMPKGAWPEFDEYSDTAYIGFTTNQ